MIYNGQVFAWIIFSQGVDILDFCVRLLYVDPVAKIWSKRIRQYDEHHQNLFLANCAEFWKQSDKEKYDLINASL